MSALGDIGDAIDNLTGQTGNYSLFDLTKNKGIQGGINNAISNYGTTASEDQADLGNYIKNYISGTPQATQETGQEVSALDRFYNGDVASQLAGFDAQQSNLGNAAVAMALAQNRGNLNKAVLGGGGAGDNSWAQRAGINTAANLNLQNSTNLLKQQRQDANYLAGNQIALAGQRENLNNTLAARALVPAQARQANLGFDTGELSNLANVNNANNMFGAKYTPSTLQDVGDLVSSIAVGGDPYANGSVYGSGYQGGSTPTGPQNTSPTSFTSPSPNQMAALDSGAGPVNADYADTLAGGSGSPNYDPSLMSDYPGYGGGAATDNALSIGGSSYNPSDYAMAF